MGLSLGTPKEMRDRNKEGLSIWLYRVIRDEERLNDPPVRVGFSQIKYPPLPLRLHYLMVPIVNAADPLAGAETEQRILEKVLQTFHDHPQLRGMDLQGDFKDTESELNVRLESLSLEEITRVWDALEGSYQLSVSYEVGVAYVESALQMGKVSPVNVALPEYGVSIPVGV